MSGTVDQQASRAEGPDARTARVPTPAAEPNSHEPTRRILVMTKFRGVNVGNQGLTLELIDALDRDSLRASCRFVGRTSGLSAFTLRSLRKSKDPIAKFEQWADSLCETASSLSGHLGTEPVDWSAAADDVRQRVEVFRAGGTSSRLSPVRRMLKPAKIMVDRHLRRSRAYAKRLTEIARSETVIYNGAGEVGEHDLFLHQVLQLRVARLLGANIIPINQSVQLHDPVMLELAGHVYSQADAIFVRGTPSQKRLVENGVDPAKIHIAPDLVFRTSKPEQPDIERAANAKKVTGSMVGLCLTRWHTESLDEWRPVIKRLRGTGKEIVFVTNSPDPDLAVGRRMERQFGIRVANPRYDYRDYAALLAGFDFVISSRLHTCILSNISGVPAIPLDNRNEKLSETYDGIDGYPLKTVDVFRPGWQKVLLSRIDAVQEGDRVRAAVAEAAKSAAHASLGNVSWLWNS